MPKLLSDAAVAQYHDKGYYFPVSVLSPDEAADCRRRIEAFEASQGGRLRGNKRIKLHVLFPWIADLARHPTVLNAVEDLLGPNLLCFQSIFFTKEAMDPGFVSWHQDSTYGGLSTAELATVWLAFTPSSRDNGCLRVVPGSHKLDQLPHRDTFDRNNLLTRGQEIAVAVGEGETVDIELAPGEASLHHVQIAHASEPNCSDDRRIGLALRYVPTHVRQTTGMPDSALLVRGADEYRHFEPEPLPTTELDPAALAFHERITTRKSRIMYRGTNETSYR